MTLGLANGAQNSVVVWGSGAVTNVPVDVTNVVSVGTGYDCVAVLHDGHLRRWGSGITNVPTVATNVIAVSAGAYHNLALKADGTVLAWGDNLRNQTNAPYYALTNVVAIAAGGSQSLALRSDGTLVAWGWNTFGPITQYPPVTNVIGIAAGRGSSMLVQRLLHRIPEPNASADPRDQQDRHDNQDHLFHSTSHHGWRAPGLYCSAIALAQLWPGMPGMFAG